MSVRSAVSPEGQSANFVELFFDLVFVFSVTQTVSLLHGQLSWRVVGQAVLVFWLVWWAWSQFTWSLNVADTTHPMIALATLMATAVAFFIAVALPNAFLDRGLWFAVPYVVVRVIGIAIYIWVAREDASQRTGIRNFAVVSVAGMIAVLVGGALGGTAQYWLWGTAIVLDMVAAATTGRSEEWALRASHFSERHGLFVIIALGETLIVAGAGLTHATWTNNLILLAILAVGISCGFWWSYFPRAMPALERALESLRGSRQAGVARDVYSLFHYFMLLGVIAYAFAIEEAVAHPAEPLPLEGRLALAMGSLLFVGGMALAIWRATRHVLVLRLLVTLATAATIVVVSGVAPAISLGFAFVGVVIVAASEQRVFNSGKA